MNSQVHPIQSVKFQAQPRDAVLPSSKPTRRGIRALRRYQSSNDGVKDSFSSFPASGLGFERPYTPKGTQTQSKGALRKYNTSIGLENEGDVCRATKIQASTAVATRAQQRRAMRMLRRYENGPELEALLTVFQTSNKRPTSPKSSRFAFSPGRMASSLLSPMTPRNNSSAPYMRSLIAIVPGYSANDIILFRTIAAASKGNKVIMGEHLKLPPGSRSLCNRPGLKRRVGESEKDPENEYLLFMGSGHALRVLLREQEKQREQDLDCSVSANQNHGTRKRSYSKTKPSVKKLLPNARLIHGFSASSVPLLIKTKIAIKQVKSSVLSRLHVPMSSTTTS
jgi:hypothetical protein